MLEAKKKICPGGYIHMLIDEARNELRDTAELTQDEWKVFNYISANIMINISGNYCKCEPCMQVYEIIKNQMPHEPIEKYVYAKSSKKDSNE